MQTKYKIKRLVLGKTPELDITSSEFQKLKIARKALSAGLAIEDKYDVLWANYEEFEKEIMNITVESMVRPPRKYNDFRDHRAKINQRLINLLTTSCLYVDSIARHVSDIIMTKKQAKAKITSFCTEKRKNCFEYQFMEELRNYTQHRDLPIHFTAVNSRLSNVDDPETKFIFTFDVACEKILLEQDKRSGKRFPKKLPEKVDLKQTTRKYIECLSEIHANVRILVADKLDEMRNLILNYRNKYNNKTGDNGVGLDAVSLSESSKIIEKVPMLLDWDDVRIELTQKNNAPIINLARRYVSGESLNKQ